jgi:hypothetical protein
MVGKSHIGKAGQLAAMAEFLLRGYNVAQPEVDLGGRYFRRRRRERQMSRIQVKTAIGKATRYGWTGQFFIVQKQLKTVKTPELFYVLALRCEPQWEFVVVPRPLLDMEYDVYGVGTLNQGTIVFTVRFQSQNVLCSSRSFQSYRNDWSNWPRL